MWHGTDINPKRLHYSLAIPALSTALLPRNHSIHPLCSATILAERRESNEDGLAVWVWAGVSNGAWIDASFVSNKFRWLMG